MIRLQGLRRTGQVLTSTVVVEADGPSATQVSDQVNDQIGIPVYFVYIPLLP